MEEIAYWEVLESGKPISQVCGEVDGCVGMFEYTAGLARSLHGDSFNNLIDTNFLAEPDDLKCCVESVKKKRRDFLTIIAAKAHPRDPLPR